MISGAAVNVLDFGADPTGVSDSRAAIQAALDTLKSVYFPAGSYKIIDTLTFPLGNYNRVYFGDGRGTTAIVATGMTGKNAIELADTAGLYRFSMRDFSVIGDADSAMYLSTTQEVYQGLFQNMSFSSVAGSALYMNSEFSNTFINVNAQSTTGHAFELKGGVGTSLIGCYAIQCGSDKAGYRIYERATLVSCNGIDSGGIWGSFGRTMVDDGAISVFEVSMMGCNLEDFGTHAINIGYTGRLNLNSCNFVAKSAGTYSTLIQGGSVSNWRINDQLCTFTTKGSTRTDSSNVVVSNQGTAISSTGLFSDYYVVGDALTYTPGGIGTSFPSYGVATYDIPKLSFTTAYGFKRPNVSIWTANATTFNVASVDSILTANTVATSFNYASNGILGQTLTIVVNDAHTTIKHNQSYNGRFLNSSGADIVAASGSVFMYVSNGTNWVQV